LATDAILELTNVVAGYGKMTILHGTTFEVKRNAITTVIGPNGAGKSTAFKTIFVKHNLEFGGVVAPKGFDLAGRMQVAMERFPVLRRKANHQASTLSGGEQKMLEIARGLVLEPKLMLIDEPSIGLSPILVADLFQTLKELRDRGITILMIEQNAKRALENSDYGLVLELGRARIAGTAPAILADKRIGQLFLGGGL
jgi:branched-chain amino acid transport system ATP-binding protein